MRAAAVQMCSSDDIAANLSAAKEFIRSAAGEGATLVVLPENFSFMSTDEARKLAIIESPGSGPVQDFLATAALELGVWLLGGTTPLRGDEPKRAYSASLFYGPDGRCVARYDKMHLFDVGVPGNSESYRESATAIPGERVVSVDTPFGRVGLAVCYDVRFPAQFDVLGRLGVDILALPAAFTVPTGEAHWSVLLRARAIESLCYVVAAAQVGQHPGGRRTYGHSMIVGPWGEVLVERADTPGIIVADIDIMHVRKLRERFPALSHRRDLERPTP